MWGTADAFHMSWICLSGDVTLTADVHFPPEGSAIPLKKAVLIVRQSLDPDSAYADVAVHGDGHITLQYRESKGGENSRYYFAGTRIDTAADRTQGRSVHDVYGSSRWETDVLRIDENRAA